MSGSSIAKSSVNVHVVLSAVRSVYLCALYVLSHVNHRAKKKKQQKLLPSIDTSVDRSVDSDQCYLLF